MAHSMIFCLTFLTDSSIWKMVSEKEELEASPNCIATSVWAEIQAVGTARGGWAFYMEVKSFADLLFGSFPPSQWTGGSKNSSREGPLQGFGTHCQES